MWAYYIYNTVPHNPQIDPLDADVILQNLAPDEHVELLLRGRLRTSFFGEAAVSKNEWPRRVRDDGTEELIDPEEFEGWPTGLAVWTIERALFLDPETGHLLNSPLKEGSTRGNRGGTKHAPAINWAKTVNYGDTYIQLFTPTHDILQILDEGAGEHILRLPLQPGVPSPPALTESAASDEKLSWFPTGYLTGWESAEGVAKQHLQYMGFSGVDRTNNGSDGGIDIRGNDVAAQVKMTALPVGRPVLQQLVGATPASCAPICYSTSGYSKEAETYATENGVALFLVENNGDVRAANTQAQRVENTQPSSPEALHWQKAYIYRDEVLARLNAFINGANEYGGDYITEPSVARRRLRYLLGSIALLRKKPEFATARDLIVHFHHAEQLAAVAALNYEQPYPIPPSQSVAEPSLSDFY